MLSFNEYKIIFGHKFTKKYNNRKDDIEYIQAGEHIKKLMNYLDRLEQHESTLNGAMLSDIIFYIDGYTVI